MLKKKELFPTFMIGDYWRRGCNLRPGCLIPCTRHRLMNIDCRYWRRFIYRQQSGGNSAHGCAPRFTGGLNASWGGCEVRGCGYLTASTFTITDIFSYEPSYKHLYRNLHGTKLIESMRKYSRIYFKTVVLYPYGSIGGLTSPINL